MIQQHHRFVLAAVMLLAAFPGHTIDVSVAGGWSLSVDTTDLSGGAGSNLVSSFSSAANQVTLTISNTSSSSDAWRVEAYRSGDWPAGVTQYLRRTSAGSGNGSISGGAGYMTITTIPATLFSGTGDRGNVELQLRAEGLSVANSPDFWVSSLVYTVVDE